MGVKELAKWSMYYDMSIMVHAPDWYHKGDAINHQHSLNIIASKGLIDNSSYFIPLIKTILDEMGIDKSKADLITIVPKSDLSYSVTLDSIARWIESNHIIKYDKIIVRTKKGRRNIGCKNYKERFKETSFLNI